MRRDVYENLVRMLTLPTCAWPHCKLVADRFRYARMRFVMQHSKHNIGGSWLQGSIGHCRQYLYAGGAAAREANPSFTKSCNREIRQQVSSNPQCHPLDRLPIAYAELCAGITMAQTCSSSVQKQTCLLACFCAGCWRSLHGTATKT